MRRTTLVGLTLAVTAACHDGGPEPVTPAVAPPPEPPARAEPVAPAASAPARGEAPAAAARAAPPEAPRASGGYGDYESGGPAAPDPVGDACRLRISSQPLAAAVTIDGRAAGVTPLPPILATPGAHQVSFTIAGSKPKTLTLSCRAGETKTVHARLGD